MQVLPNGTVYLESVRTYDNVTDGEMHKSIDFGESWMEVSLPPELDYSQIKAIDFLRSRMGYAWSFEDKIFKTSDGGVSWTKVSSLLGVDADLCFLNERVGFLIGNRKIFKTENAGTHWTLDYSSSEEFLEMGKTEANGLFVVGRNGSILRRK